MANNYYLIPLVGSKVRFNGTPLDEITKKIFPGIVVLEDDRIGLLNSRTPFCKVTKEDVKKYNQLIDNINLVYEALYAPHYIIARGSDNVAYELITGTKITPMIKGALSLLETPEDLVQDYFDDSDYKNRINEFYIQYIGETKDPFGDTKVTSRVRSNKNSD